MIPTFSWAPLKNSGFRSIGMSSVALLFPSDRSAVEGIHVYGDTTPSATPTRSGPASHRTDVKETSKYSRFRTNKKRRAFRLLPLVQGRLPQEAGGRKIEELASNCRNDTHRAVRSP